ncbi:hypothetical protein AX14_002841 [Amanita brunnescens Koide BX004]|nr:hypothetical protein AX14_002841 [Amanita brunnescens Koide BX004]
MSNQGMLVPWETFQDAPFPVANLRHSPPRARSMTNPSQPHSLFPARRPSTVHTSDIYFVPPSKTNRPVTSSSTSPSHSPSSSTTGSTAYPHPFHRSFTCPPPIPPKPFELQHERVGKCSPATIPETDPKADPTEEDELTTALALSRSESRQRQSALQKLGSQEEEDLARALAESLKSSLPPPPGAVHASDPVSVVSQESTTPTQSSPPNDATTPTSNSAGLVINTEGLQERVVTKSMPVPTASAVDPSNPVDDDPCANDEAIALRLAREETSLAKSFNNRGRLTEEDATPTSPSRSQSVPSIASFITNDDRYAKQLTEQEAGTSSTGRTRSKSAIAVVELRSSAISGFPPPDSDFSSSSSHGSTRSHSSSQNISGSSSGTQPSLSVTAPDQSANELHQPPRPTDRSLSSTSISSLLTSPSTEWVVEDSASMNGAVNPYVTDELLKGISIGFDPPLISLQISTWQSPLPTIISLPYGRSLPLHIQATNWRHILKLLARLPGTTIQATIEAMAVTKTDHRLRTVVQFVKPHLVSNEWRTILWFTLEHPVPDDVTGRSRYVTDVNVLPWSYSFSTAPQLLRGGTESQLSKTYTIPASSSLPFPTLPITFPDLAMYLHGALETSRRHINDSSSGVRKLAKMIEICYPSVNAVDPDDPDRGRVSGLFKNLMGRGNRRRGGNEDTYDLVTPFVASEWG